MPSNSREESSAKINSPEPRIPPRTPTHLRRRVGLTPTCVLLNTPLSFQRASTLWKSGETTARILDEPGQPLRRWNPDPSCLGPRKPSLYLQARTRDSDDFQDAFHHQTYSEEQA